MKTWDKYKNIITNSKKFKKEKNYWLNKLDGELAITSITTDFQRVKLSQYKIGTVNHKFSNDVFTKLISMSNDFDLALYIILLSAINYLLYKYTNNEDIIVGMPVFKESDEESIEESSEKEYINNIVALRSYVNTEDSFKNLVFEVSNTID